MFPTSNGPPFQIFLNDSHSAGSRGFLFLIAFSVHPISPPCFKLKAPLPQRVLGSIYWWVLGKVEQFVRCSVLKRMPIWRIEAYFHRNGLRRGLWRKPLVFRTPPWVTANIYSSISSSWVPECFSGSCMQIQYRLSLFLVVIYIPIYFASYADVSLVSFIYWSTVVMSPLDAVSHPSYTATLGYSFFASGMTVFFSCSG